MDFWQRTRLAPRLARLAAKAPIAPMVPMAPSELKFEDTEVEDIEVPAVLELLGNCRATPEVGNMQKEYGRSYSICGEIDHDSEFQFTGFCLCISSWKISPYKSLNQKTRQPGDSDSNSRPGATNPALITPAAPTAKVIIPALDR